MNAPGSRRAILALLALLAAVTAWGGPEFVDPLTAVLARERIGPGAEEAAEALARACPALVQEAWVSAPARAERRWAKAIARARRREKGRA